MIFVFVSVRIVKLMTKYDTMWGDLDLSETLKAVTITIFIYDGDVLVSSYIPNFATGLRS